jgi:hypothetical protein
MTSLAKSPVHAGLASGRTPTGFAAARSAVWTFLTEIGRSRARSEMLRTADRFDLSQPELAAQLRACAASETPKAR